MPSTKPTIRNYDIIVFGDEIPGVLALVSAAREYFRQTKKYPRSLLLLKGDAKLGIGGHLVRGGLSYLDRSSIPVAIRKSYQLDTFGDPAAIYKEFLHKAQVKLIALDPSKGSTALQDMLREVGADVIGNFEFESVLKQDGKISGIRLLNGDVYMGKQFVDCTVNAELAQAAGVRKLKGFGTLGLPDAELAVTLTFETQGLSIATLTRVEEQYLKRFTSRGDAAAQDWLDSAAGYDTELATQFRENLVDKNGNLKKMYVGQDYIDVRCKALSIAYHAFRGTTLSLKESGAILDNGNIAILPGDRLSWNAFLYGVNADEAEALARGKAKPTANMLKEMEFIIKWFKSIGAKAVKPASELYIRHAGNIIGVVDPLSGHEMLAGGVPASEALGTFGYHFDVRGGIEGLGVRSTEKGFGEPEFPTPPLFNIGIQHALVKDVPNLAVISPGSGFQGCACSAGRIIEFNCGVGQGVGIAAAQAIISKRNLADFSNKEVRAILEQTGKLPKIYGQNYAEQASKLRDFEISMADSRIAVTA
jgi:FAD dependent oxidoreductase